MTASTDAAQSASQIALRYGIAGVVILLLGGVLWLAHEERMQAEEHQYKLIAQMMTECFDAKSASIGLNFDRIIELQEMAKLEEDIAYVESLVEADNAAGN